MDDGADSGEEVTSPGSAAAVTVAAARGFAAQLRGVSLWDLVQMECLARSRLTAQVVGDGGVGYLYFDGGHIVHASTALRVGESAALEILSWTNGSFQPCDRPWPEQRTIITSHEALILHAAQLRDESGATNLVAFPGRSAAASVGPAAGPAGYAGDETFEDIELTEIEEEGEGSMRTAITEEGPPPPKPARPDNSGDFAVVLRLGATGAIISNRGGNDELAETIAYVQRLLELAGELLGLEPFAGLDCGFTEGRCIIFPDGDGEVVALRPRPEANLQPLRERLGL
jgi:hypothetical protein